MSAQYTSVALEIHCFGVNIPSHPHASGGWREEIDSGNDVVCPEYLKRNLSFISAVTTTSN